MAFYSGESISYAEIGYFVPNTYAFPISTMNEGHIRALDRFSKVLGIVGSSEIDTLTQVIKLNPIDMAKKKAVLQNGPHQDTNKIGQKVVGNIVSLPDKKAPVRASRPQ
jgi:hypothetical protein